MCDVWLSFLCVQNCSQGSMFISLFDPFILIGNGHYKYFLIQDKLQALEILNFEKDRVTTKQQSRTWLTFFLTHGGLS